MRQRIDRCREKYYKSYLLTTGLLSLLYAKNIKIKKNKILMSYKKLLGVLEQ